MFAPSYFGRSYFGQEYFPSGGPSGSIARYVTAVVRADGVTLRFNFALNNYTATTDPTVDDDCTLGYAVGSEWANTIEGTEFKLFDNSIGAAVWVAGAGGSSFVYGEP